MIYFVLLHSANLISMYESDSYDSDRHTSMSPSEIVKAELLSAKVAFNSILDESKRGKNLLHFIPKSSPINGAKFFELDDLTPESVNKAKSHFFDKRYTSSIPPFIVTV